MNKSTIVLVGNVLIFFSIVFTLWLAVALEPTSNTILVIFGFWAIAPYLLFAYFVNLRSTTFRQSVENVAVSFICSLGGIYWEIYITMINSDAQGGLAVITIPFLQLVAFLLLRFILWGVQKF